MLAYIIRRLLWMIPTFLGILIINFGVLRLQGTSLADELNQGKGGAGAEAGTVRADVTSGAVEKSVAKMRHTGNDLPALINIRGFIGKDGVVAMLEAAERKSDDAADAARCYRAETTLWLMGPLLVEPLGQVLADDSLARLHGPAAMALSLCAFVSAEDVAPDDDARLAFVQGRNQDLKADRISYENHPGTGFVTTDPAAAAKRAALLAIIARDHAEFARGNWRRWTATVCETGFSVFCTRLATGRLWSESRKEPVFSLLARRWYVTFGLNLTSIIIAWGLAVRMGVSSAKRAGTVLDTITTQVLFLLWSLPTFFVAALFLHHFCTDHGDGHPAWFPNRGISSPNSEWLDAPHYCLDLLWHAVLPLILLTYGSFTSLSRYMRANVLEQLRSDYVRTARAKGCSEDQVLKAHATRNSLLTMITLGSGLLAELFSGALIVEFAFSIPGLGWLLVDAAVQHDTPLIMANTVITVGLLLIGILLADLLYAAVDPRLRGRYG